jgi:hypothetical protein
MKSEQKEEKGKDEGEEEAFLRRGKKRMRKKGEENKA